MDDFSTQSLSESKNEWCARLVNTLTPAIISGLKSIFNEAWTLCVTKEEEDKYLMTFQTFLSRVPKWNPTIIIDERKRICEVSGCGYLEDLITCVHIIQLKALTCVRVGQKQKKVDINIPSIDDFIHKVYMNVARKIYTNIYLFEKNIAPLQIQKHNRELELIIRECILNSVRESIPVESLLRAYMDETEEQDVEVKIVEEPLPPVIAPLPLPLPPPVPVQTQTPAPVQTPAIPAETEGAPRISFDTIDHFKSVDGNMEDLFVSKAIPDLEEKARISAETDNDNDNDNDKIKIGGDISIDLSDINDLNKPAPAAHHLLPPPVLDDIEVLV